MYETESNPLHDKVERVQCISTFEQKPAADRFNELYKEHIMRQLAVAKPKPKHSVIMTIVKTAANVLNPVRFFLG